jgi:low affinity Fe/Cu permease
LIRVSTARNSFVGIELLTDEELDDIRARCEHLAKTEKFSEKAVQLTGKKAGQAADRVTD